MVDPLVEKFSVTHYARPWLSNDEWSGNARGIGGRKGRTSLKRQWKDDFCRLALAAKVPALEWIEVTVRQCCRDRRRPDVGGCYPAAKAAIDGLVDAGVIPNDTDEYVHQLTFVPAIVTGYDALRLELDGPRCSPEERKRRTIAAEQVMRRKALRQVRQWTG